MNFFIPVYKTGYSKFVFHKKKQETKENIEKKLGEGVPQKKIANEEGISVDTVQRTKKSLTDRKNGKSKKTAKMPNDTFAPSASKSPTSPVDR